MERIPSFAWSILLIVCLFATFGLFGMFWILSVTGRDFWIAILLALPALLPLLLWTRFAMPSPRPGSLLRAVAYALAAAYFLLLSVMTVHVMNDMMGTLLEETPAVAIALPFLAVVVYAAHSGLEVVARLAVLVLPVVLMGFGVILVLALPLVDPGNLLPILDGGWGPVFRSASLIAAWWTGFILLAPWVERERSQPACSCRPLLLGFGTVALLLTLLGGLLVGIFGLRLQVVTYPVFVLSRMVNISHLLTRFVSLAISPAFLGVFLMATLFLWGSSRAAADAFHLADNRPLLLPLGFWALFFVLHGFPGKMALVSFLQQTFPVVALILGFLVPLLSWLGRTPQVRP